MRNFEIPTSRSKLRLLDAAERQVAEKGFDAVSVRDVTELAKANVAAVNYHFGSREGMMALVIGRRVLPVLQDRLDRLTVVEKKWGARGAPLEELLDAFLRPLVVLPSGWELEDHWGQRLLARILSLAPDALPGPVGEAMAELWRRYLRALGKALPALAAEELAWRLHFLTGAANRMLAGSTELEKWAGLVVDSPAAEAQLGKLLRFAVPALRDGAAGVAKSPEKKPPQATFDF